MDVMSLWNELSVELAAEDGLDWECRPEICL